MFGLLGIVWAIAFYWWFRDEPAEHHAVNAAERRMIEHGAAAAAELRASADSLAKHSEEQEHLAAGDCADVFLGDLLHGDQLVSELSAKRASVSSQQAAWLASLVLAGAAVGCLASGYCHRLTSAR